MTSILESGYGASVFVPAVLSAGYGIYSWSGQAFLDDSFGKAQGSIPSVVGSAGVFSAFIVGGMSKRVDGMEMEKTGIGMKVCVVGKSTSRFRT